MLAWRRLGLPIMQAVLIATWTGGVVFMVTDEQGLVIGFGVRSPHPE